MIELLPDDGIIDTVAVERVLDGRHAALTRSEIVEVIRRHIVEREGSLATAAALLSMNRDSARKYVNRIGQERLFGQTLRSIYVQRAKRSEVPHQLLSPSSLPARFKRGAA